MKQIFLPRKITTNFLICSSLLSYKNQIKSYPTISFLQLQASLLTYIVIYTELQINLKEFHLINAQKLYICTISGNFLLGNSFKYQAKCIFIVNSNNPLSFLVLGDILCNIPDWARIIYLLKSSGGFKPKAAEQFLKFI